MKTLLHVAALGCIAVLASCKPKADEQAGEAKGGTLVITAIPDQKVSDQEANFAPLKDYLSKELGVDVAFSISDDYPAAVQRFKNGEVHLVWFGGLTGVQAWEAVPGARAIAQGDVDPQYKSYFIAHKSTGLEKSDTFPKDKISDMTFTFGSQSSTSGRLMPAYFIEQETGKKPEDFFTKPVQFSGAHDATARAVASGSVQIGAINYKTYDSMVAAGDISAEDAPIFWITPEYVDYNLTVHPDLNKMFGDDFIDKLQDALVACDDKNVLKAFNRDKLIPAKNEDFESIKDVAKELNMMR
ncbi:putative selenate ABC transporter substrate-binding protein [Roseibacillus persicicus]|uniref:Selenate ABC transporter substrate-binding protein n=1 Tax=Roseibacillus persicicus TaxID=454148 RepID=A0A918WFY6_9BACT|nr:putative selenate ABC transporter substrate-binding protein [Roseibacillus persicicus]GHC43015.1 putative selenate ABC transporter substrate-binding protein [Roseibacillus persicicus]